MKKIQDRRYTKVKFIKVNIEDFWIETTKPEEFADELAELCVKYAVSYTDKIENKKLDIRSRKYSFDFDPETPGKWIFWKPRKHGGRIKNSQAI